MDFLDISGHPALLAVSAGLTNIATHANNVNLDHEGFRMQAKACAEHGLEALNNDY